MAPTQMAPVVRRHPETGERHLDLLQWGLLPYFTKDPVHARRPINARAETVTTSGMFRRAFELRRAIVPADAFYEWWAIDGGKQPYALARSAVADIQARDGSSRHVRPAVNVEDLAGNGVGIFRSEKHGSSCNLIGF